MQKRRGGERLPERSREPPRIRELTNPRFQIHHFTSCHKPYVVFIHAGDDPEGWREEMKSMLSWSKGYQVEIRQEFTPLQFIDAVEQRD